MGYSTIGFLGAIIHAVINHDMFLPDSKANRTLSQKAYRAFLFAVLAYFISDAIWGILDENHLVAALYVDTAVYFAAMAVSVLLWTRFVIAYLGQDNTFSKFLHIAGYAMFAFVIVILAVNVFWPVLFWFEADGTYHAAIARYLLLVFQIALFLLASMYTLLAAGKTEGAVKRHYLTIGLFGLAMIVATTLQVFYPLMPMYAMGCMLGICVLHSFVEEDEKDEHRRELEEVIRRKNQQEQELGSTRKLAYTDSLTGVKNVRSYADTVERLESRIESGDMTGFATVVFDLNNLKITNDMMGHEAGNQLLIDACKLICDSYKHSPVFRIGGDEFVAILEGADFLNRFDLLSAFESKVDENVKTGGTIVASGMSEYDPIVDGDYHSVFARADSKMYLRKQSLKAMSNPPA